MRFRIALSCIPSAASWYVGLVSEPPLSQSGRRDARPPSQPCLWKLPDLWTHSTRPQGPWRTADGSPQLPPAIIHGLTDGQRTDSPGVAFLPTDSAEEPNLMRGSLS